MLRTFIIKVSVFGYFTLDTYELVIGIKFLYLSYTLVRKVQLIT